MPKLINLTHPYELVSLNNIEKFLFFSKNIFREIKKSGCREKIDGILVPVRWSKLKSTWVVDRGTSKKRDKVGVDLNNIDEYYDKSEKIYNAVSFILNAVSKSKEFNSIARKFNLHKNEKKFFAFEYVNNRTNYIDYKEEKIFLLGLYVRHNKNRDNLVNFKIENSTCLDNSEIVDILISCSLSVCKPKLFYITENYKDTYKDFLKYLSSQEYFNNKDFDFFKSNNYYLNKTLELKKIRHLITNKEEITEKQSESVLKILLAVYLGEFLKNYFKVKSIEGFIVYDKTLNKNLKLTGNDILREKKTFKTILKKEKSEYNNISLLPKAF